MSVRALSWSFALPLQDMAAKGVLHALADHADEDWKCWPSLARIALFVGCSENTARRALQRVEAMGIISREARPGQSDMYRLNADFQLVVEAPAKSAKTTVPYTKAEIPYLLRHAVFVRDGMTCLHCGETDADQLTADHVIPEFHGGPTTMENLQTLCMPCNRKKGIEPDPSQIGTSHDGTSHPATPPLPRWDHTPPKLVGDPSQGGTRTVNEPSKNRQSNPKGDADAKPHRLPADWQPSQDCRQFAADLGLDADATAEAFIDYWTGKGAATKRTDWARTWRVWCRRETARPVGKGAARAFQPTRGNDAFYQQLADIARRPDDQ